MLHLHSITQIILDLSSLLLVYFLIKIFSFFPLNLLLNVCILVFLRIDGIVQFTFAINM